MFTGMVCFLYILSFLTTPFWSQSLFFPDPHTVWADHADIISLQYSGTGALKTDFTRTGKRTPLGAVRDGIHSLTRYFKNNFTDGFRQDAIDLFLGNYSVDRNEGLTIPCPLDRKKDWKFMALPLIVLGSIAMFFFSLFVPHEHSTETFIYLCFWFGMISFSMMVIVFFGTEFVDHPKLSDRRIRFRSSIDTEWSNMGYTLWTSVWDSGFSPSTSCVSFFNIYSRSLLLFPSEIKFLLYMLKNIYFVLLSFSEIPTCVRHVHLPVFSLSRHEERFPTE